MSVNNVRIRRRTIIMYMYFLLLLDNHLTVTIFINKYNPKSPREL